MGLVEVVRAEREGDTIMGPLCSSGCSSQDEGGGWAVSRASLSPYMTVYEHPSQKENKAK